MIFREIPSTKELLPVIGIGTWKAFDASDATSMTRLGEVIALMHNGGGTLIDSSPMYGRAEEVIGQLTSGLKTSDDFFYATKVWTEGREAGIHQMNESMRLMQRNSIDLMQIHNLVDWKTHLKTLRDWKESGKVRYIGITHYTDAMHDELVRIIGEVSLDFVQFNYSITARNAEKRLLPAAADKGIATLINRPLGEGKLMAAVRDQPLPVWASDHGIGSWGQFFLKFIIAHPAVTCVIPGTGNPDHMRDNIEACQGELPDEQGRIKMAAYVAAI